MRGVYLNHAGTSWPKPPSVHAAAQEVWNSDPLDWSDQFESHRRQVAEFFHVADPSQLLLTPGCTSALSIAVNDHFWKAGDRALTSGFEHHALHRPLVKLLEQGVDVEVLPHLDHEPLVLEALEDALKRGRVRLVAITAASNVTGELMPIKDVIALSHQYDAQVLIDAAQVAGWWDLNLPALGADLVAFAGHKGLQAPWGVGGLYVGSDVKMNSPGAVCEISCDRQSAESSGPGYCDVGSVDRTALAGLAAAATWLREPSRGERLSTARQLSQQLLEGIQRLPQVTLFSPDSPAARMPTVAFRLENLDSVRAAKALSDRGVIVAGGMQCAPLTHKTLETAPGGLLRMSVGPDTNFADITQAVTAVEEIASMAAP